MKKFHIYASDEMGKDIVLVDEDGNRLENVTEVTVRYSVGELSRAEITLLGTGVNVKNVHIDRVEFICPSCGDYTAHECSGNILGALNST